MSQRINLGRVMPINKRAYSSSVSYAVMDIVEYEGSSYWCIQACQGVLPTNTTNWQLMSQKGADGSNGTNGVDGEDAYQPFKGWYDSSSSLSSSISSPVVGDYAYVMGATASDPVTVYMCSTAGTWTASQNEFNPANNQSFQTGQDLDQTKIINDLTTGGANHVLSAEAGKTLNTALGQLGQNLRDTKKEIFDVELPLSFETGTYQIVNGELTFNSSGNWGYCIVPVGDAIRVNTTASVDSLDIPAIIFLTGAVPSQSTYMSGEDIYGDGDSASSIRLKIFDDVVKVPNGATHFIVNSYGKGGKAYKKFFIAVDSTPTSGSSNAVSSGGVYNAINPLSKKVTDLSQSLETATSTPTDSACATVGKFIRISNGQISLASATSVWRYGIVPAKGVTHIKTFSGASSTDCPAIVFLRTNQVTQESYIAGSEIYGNIHTQTNSIKGFDEDITIPAAANYIGINLYSPYADSNTKITAVANKVDDLSDRVSNLERSGNVIVVKKTPSTGEYSTIASALAVAQAGDTIKIYDGIYEEYHLDIIRGLTIIGIGDVEIKGVQAASAPLTQVTNWSTLECYQGVTMRNIKVSAKNLRYPIHADFSYGNSIWDIEACTFIHYGNNEVYEYQSSVSGGTPTDVLNSCSAWGGGTRGGDIVRIMNCRFESTGRAFSTHNNTNESYMQFGASHVRLENCIMVSHAIDRDNSLYDFPDPIHVQNLDCPVEGCDVVISNCIFNGYIVLQNSGGDGFSNNVKIFNCGDFKQCFHSYGSANAAYTSGSQISTYAQHYTGHIMSDFCKYYINRGNSSISAGKAVKKTTKGGVAAYDNTSDDVLGVAMEDIAVGAIGIVWAGGFLPRIYFDGIRTTTINEGATIYVDNTGTFATTGTKAVFKAADAQNIDMASPN